METVRWLTAMAAVASYGLLWLGAPILLVDWLRRRRREAVLRQIALTDAIDARLGPVVSPVVTKPLRGPWQVEIAAPVLPFWAVGRILAIAEEVFSSADRATPGSYRIILTPGRGLAREKPPTRPGGLAGGWQDRTRFAA